MNRHISNRGACVRYLPLALLFTFILFRPFDLRSQTLECHEFSISPVPGDTILVRTDPDRVVVRVDTTANGQDRTVVRAACADINTAGFYHIRTGIRYSNGQGNESFYLTLRNAGTPPDSLTTPTCPTNAGPYYVLQDVVGDTSVERFNQIRDAGLFYFAAGADTIILNHYFNIQEEYPSFLNPPGEMITRDDIESVHIFQMEIRFVAETLDDFGPKLSKQALDPETEELIATIEPDQLFTYKLAVENVGPLVSRDLVLTDVLPEHLLIEDTSFNIPPSSISAGSDTLVWRFSSLDAGASREITFQAKVDGAASHPPLPFPLVNGAVVTSQCNRDSAAAEVRVVAPPAYDLALEKTVSPMSALRGEYFDYRIRLENLGPDPASGITLIDVLPELMRHSDFINPPMDTMAVDTLRWQIDSLGVGESEEMRYRGQFPLHVELPSAPLPRVNRAEVFSLHDTNAVNDTSSAAVTIVNPQYDLSVSKSVAPSSVKRGEVFEYVITVENGGPETAEDVLLVDVLPEFVNHFDFREPPRDTTATDTLRWNFKALLAGERVEIGYRGSVSESLALPTAPFTRTNRVTVFGEFDTDAANNSAEASVDIVLPDYDLEVSKSVTPGSAKQDEPFSYSITVRNQGPDAAEDVMLWDTLPDFVTVSDFVNSPIDTTATDTLWWNLGLVVDGEVREFRYRGVVPTSVDLPEIPSIRSNLAGVASEFDRDASNDTASAQVAVIAEEDCIVLSHNVFEPARQELEISFELKRSSPVSLKVYDITGYEVSTLEENTYTAGIHEFVWDGKTGDGQNVGSGVYLIILRSNTLDCLEKVIIVR